MAAIPIVGLGMCTPLGFNSRSTFAAVRGGLVNFRDSETIGDDGEPVRASILDEFDAVSREARMAELATVALKDASESAGSEVTRHASLFIGLPDSEIGSPGFDADTFRHMLEASIGELSLDISSPALFQCGRSSFFAALHAAISRLTSRQSSFAIVGGVDSQCDPATLEVLSAQDRILSAAVIDGMIPGEGACFVALGVPEVSGAPVPVAAVLGSAIGREERNFLQEKPNHAEGLSNVFRQLRAHTEMTEKRPDAVMTCQTGERFWAEEFSTAYLRNANLMPEPLALVHAADSFGDAGAASGALQFGIGALMVARERSRCREAPRPRILLVYGSSDRGDVGACLVGR